MRMTLWVLLTGLLLMSFLSACGQSQENLGEKVEMQKCTTCHSNLITCTNLGKDRDYWERTVQRMVEKNMQITAAETEAVIDYLVDLPPGSSPVCD